MSSRNKKKPARKPKANAVKSKRRPHRSATLRPAVAPHARSETSSSPFARPAGPTDQPAAESLAAQTTGPTPGPTTEPTTEPMTGPTSEPVVEPSSVETVAPAAEPTAEETAAPTREPVSRWAVDDPSALWWDDVWPFKDDRHAEPGLTQTSTIVDPDAMPVEERNAGPGEEPAASVPPLSVPPASSLQSLVWVSLLVAVLAAGLVWLWATGRQPEERTVAPPQGHPYAAPVRLAANSSFVRSNVLRSGDVVVTHWIHTGRPVDAVTLQAPRVIGLAPDAVSISGVVVAADGTRMPVSSAVRSTGPTTLAVLPADRLYVRYRLSGVVQVSGGAGERALARITALDVSTTSPMVRTTLTVGGAEVLALACTPVGQDVPVPCGRDTGEYWSARLGRGQQGSQVMAQLNLS
jgi:hypothetical protein